MVKEQIDTFAAAGVNAAMNPEDLNVPGVLIRPPTIVPRFSKGCIEVTWECWAIVRDIGLKEATTAFGPLLTKIKTGFPDVSEYRTREPALMPDGPPLPAYQFTYTTRHKEEADNA